jgi:hypothetical protein
MNISNELQQMGIFLTKDGLVSILKQLTVSTVPTVETHCMARQETPHHRGQWHKPCAKHQMQVIGK